MNCDFASRFMRSIERWRDDVPLEPDAIGDLAGPAFAVYANTGLRACIDALEAAYPSVASWLGQPEFRALAARFARAHPPVDSRMFLYGAAFTDHLRSMETQGGPPFLVEVARIDRYRTEAHAAADVPILTSAELARLPADALETAVLALAPATRWHGSNESPVLALWAMGKQGDMDLRSINRRGQAVLITRPDDEILMHEIPMAGIDLLEACANERPLAEATAAAQAVDSSIDLHTLFTTLFSQGAFRSLKPLSHPSTTVLRKLP